MQQLTAGNVKLAMQAAKGSSSDLWKVPRGQIRIIEGFNVRTVNDEHAAHVRELADSIKANGFMQDKPLAGYVANDGGMKHVIYLTDGHCRLEAVELAVSEGCEIETLPVVVSPKGTNLEDLTVRLATSNKGKPLTPYELGEVCKRLTGFGWDEAQIGRRLAMTPARVADLLTLIGAPLPIRQAVANGEVSASLAISTIKKEGAGAADKISEGTRRAKAAGKKKATARHVTPDKPGAKAVVRALVQWAKDTGFEVPDDLKPVLSMARKALG